MTSIVIPQLRLETDALATASYHAKTCIFSLKYYCRIVIISRQFSVLKPLRFCILYKQVAAEKPNPTIFLKACELLGVKPEEAVHVGDDRRNDIWGARDAGCDAWLWGSDVHSFKEVLLFLLYTLPPAFTISSAEIFSWAK